MENINEINEINEISKNSINIYAKLVEYEYILKNILNSIFDELYTENTTHIISQYCSYIYDKIETIYNDALYRNSIYCLILDNHKLLEKIIVNISNDEYNIIINDCLYFVEEIIFISIECDIVNLFSKINNPFYIDLPDNYKLMNDFFIVKIIYHKLTNYCLLEKESTKLIEMMNKIENIIGTYNCISSKKSIDILISLDNIAHKIISCYIKSENVLEDVINEYNTVCYNVHSKIENNYELIDIINRYIHNIDNLILISYEKNTMSYKTIIKFVYYRLSVGNNKNIESIVDNALDDFDNLMNNYESLVDSRGVNFDDLIKEMDTIINEIIIKLL